MKRFFISIASQEKNYIDYNILSNEILLPSGDVLNFFNKYYDLYGFWIDALVKNTNRNKIKSQQVNFLKDLINGFSVYPSILKSKKQSDYKVKDLYLILLGKPSENVDNILISLPRDKNNKEIYTHAKILLAFREEIFEKHVNKKIIKSNSNQSNIDNNEKNIAEGTK